MSDKRTPIRFMKEWMDLVTEFWQSGLNDPAWCHEYGISLNCFYNAIIRKKKGALDIWHCRKSKLEVFRLAIVFDKS